MARISMYHPMRTYACRVMWGRVKKPPVTRSDFAFINFLPIANPEDDDVKAQQGIDHPVVTDAVLAKSGKLPLERGIGFRHFDQFRLNEVKDSFCFCLR